MENGFGGNHQQAVLDGGISDLKEVSLDGGYVDIYTGHPVLGGRFTDV